MKSSRLRLFFIVALSATLLIPAYSQQRRVSDVQKKKEKVERSYKKAYAKARKKTIKHRREIQTDETRERMDAVHKKARTNNKKNDAGFLERKFRRKKPAKR